MSRRNWRGRIPVSPETTRAADIATCDGAQPPPARRVTSPPDAALVYGRPHVTAPRA
jgi:hypothetical protein